MAISWILVNFASVNQSVDIEKYLDEFRTSMARMEGTVAELTEDNARLNRRVVVQNAEIRSLKSENPLLTLTYT